MPNKEISIINYNGESYTIVDSTTDSKYSVIGHHHSMSEINGMAFDGTYNASTNKIATESTVSDAVDAITAESLGLSKAMRFIGVATVEISNHSNTNPVITGYDFTNAKLGDVIIDNTTDYEYVWTAQG